MADEYKRINLLIGTQTALAAGQEEGMPGIVSDSDHRLGVYAAGAWRLMALRGGSETFSALSISGLTNGTIPLVSTAGGLLGNSSLSEDAVSIKSAKALMLNGATNPGWGDNMEPLGFGGAATLYAYLAFNSGSPTLVRNLYHDGANFRARVAPDATLDLPTLIQLDAAGEFIFASSVSTPLAGGIVSDLLTRFKVSKYGQASQWISELVTSGRYVKTTDTTIGPSAAAKASLLNGATTGFMAVTDPAARWNAVGAASETVLKGNVSSAANQVLVFELYRNGAVSATLTLPARSYGTATPWRLVIDQVVRVAGSTGTVRVKMRAYVTADNANSAASCYDMSATLTGVDLTVAHTWDVVCTIPNNASNFITCDYAKKIG